MYWVFFLVVTVNYMHLCIGFFFLVVTVNSCNENDSNDEKVSITIDSDMIDEIISALKEIVSKTMYPILRLYC